MGKTLSQENLLFDIPDLNRFKIGDEVIADATLYSGRFQGVIIGIELTRMWNAGDLEPNITILHDGYQITDGFKPRDLRPTLKGGDA